MPAKSGGTVWQLAHYGKACDADNGEVYLSSSAKVANLAACQASCVSASTPCRTVTFYPDGFCSHFVTHCFVTKVSEGAVSYTIPDASTAALIDQEISNEECTLSTQGYLTNSPGYVTHIDYCVETCAQSTECNSVTLYSDGFCSHFTGACDARTAHSGAVSVKLKANTRYPYYNLVAYDRECNPRDEAYLPATSDYVLTLRRCLETCSAASACQSVTFYHDKFCSHFSSSCLNLETVRFWTPHPGPRPPMMAASYSKHTTTTTTTSTTGGFGLDVGSGPTKLAFMIDRSGSMGSDKTGTSITRFNYVVAEVFKILEGLPAGSEFSFQAFDSALFAFDNADFVENTPVNRGRLQTWFNNHGPRSTTGMLAGIQALLTKKGEADKLYLLADGDANQKTEIINAAATGGVPINTIGVDLTPGTAAYNLLVSISDASGGTKTFV